MSSHGNVERAAFIASLRTVPGPVAIVAVALDGERRGLAATAWCSLTADPPTLLVCVNRSASAYPFILGARAFSINLLGADDLDTVALFSARRGLEGEARFRVGGWSAHSGGQPAFDRALVSYACRLVDSYDHGSHAIVIGAVDALSTCSGCDTLLYHDGAFARAVRLDDA